MCTPQATWPLIGHGARHLNLGRLRACRYTNLLTDAYDFLYNGQPDRVSARFKSARASKLNLARIWGHGDGNHVLQTGPGQYNARVFRALDYVVFQAGKNNVRVRAPLHKVLSRGQSSPSAARD